MVFPDASLQNKGVERFLNFLRAYVQLIQKQTIRLFSCDHPGRAKHTAPVHDLRHTNDIFRCMLAAMHLNPGQPNIFGKLLTMADLPMPGAPQIKTGRTRPTFNKISRSCFWLTETVRFKAIYPP